MEKYSNYKLQQHFTFPEQNSVYSSIMQFCVFFVYIYFFVFCLLGAHFMSFGMKVPFQFFSVLLCFFL